MKKIDKAAQIALSLVGCPYIFGAVGQKCTPEYREKVLTSKPSYAEKIRKYCPVLSGTQSACAGCRYNNLPSFDCRGLTWYVLHEVGIDISRVGATTQWKKNSWAEKGTIDKMPRGHACIVFRATGDVMQHTGFCTADGTVIDSRGHAYGVLCSSLSAYKWTHYAIPYGADDEYGEEVYPMPDGKFEKRVVRLNSGWLNLRGAPSRDADSVGRIPNGAIVEIRANGDTDWPFVDFNGQEGYVAGRYLMPIIEPDGSGGSSDKGSTRLIDDDGNQITLIGHWRKPDD